MAEPSIKHDLQIKFGNIYGAEEEHAVLEVLHKGAPTSGSYCQQFELDFASYHNIPFAKTVSNGTAALFLAMVAAGVKPGDQVLTTPLTWIASASAAAVLGADIDFVDVDPVTLNMDPNKLAEKITPRTKVVVPVHLYGLCCDMDPIMQLAQQHDLLVVEDACHAVGSRYLDKLAGAIGHIGCFSFHEQKNISTLGEGGMVITRDPELFERISLYRSHCTRVYGPSTKYCLIDEAKYPKGKWFWRQDFDDTGYNFRLTDIQAAVGIEQLKKLDEFNRLRQQNAAYLSKALTGINGLTLPQVPSGYDHAFHLFMVQLDESGFGMSRMDFIYEMLYTYGIKVGTHYSPLHLTEAFRRRGHKAGECPVAEAAGERIVTLPLHPRQTHEQLDYLVDCLYKLAQKR
jgi:dTDP-4-amino-4,6-dideoxygalactose transaminase